MSEDRIFICPSLPVSLRERLISGLQGAEVFFRQDYRENEGREVFMTCTVAFGSLPLEWARSADRLQWIQLDSAGLDPYQKMISEGRVRFSNLKDFFSQPVAETAVAGILALYRNIHLLLKAKNAKVWEYESIRPANETIKDKRILILGPGSIGRMIKKFLEPMGPQITMFGSRADLAGSLDKLDELLPETDILMGALPESEETIHLMNKHRLSLLPVHALVANVGRGSLFDEPELIHRLKENQLKGAFLDVTALEPLSADNDLWELPNVILGQHAGGGMPNELARKVEFFIENYHNYLEGKLKNVVKS